MSTQLHMTDAFYSSIKPNTKPAVLPYNEDEPSHMESLSVPIPPGAGPYSLLTFSAEDAEGGIVTGPVTLGPDSSTPVDWRVRLPGRRGAGPRLSSVNSTLHSLPGQQGFAELLKGVLEPGNVDLARRRKLQREGFAEPFPEDLQPLAVPQIIMRIPPPEESCTNLHIRFSPMHLRNVIAIEDIPIRSEEVSAVIRTSLAGLESACSIVASIQ